MMVDEEIGVLKRKLEKAEDRRRSAFQLAEIRLKKAEKLERQRNALQRRVDDLEALQELINEACRVSVADHTCNTHNCGLCRLRHLYVAGKVAKEGLP